jgi:hypothetical protein
MRLTKVDVHSKVKHYRPYSKKLPRGRGGSGGLALMVIFILALRAVIALELQRKQLPLDRGIIGCP